MNQYPVTDWMWNLDLEKQEQSRREIEAERKRARDLDTPERRAQRGRRYHILQELLEGNHDFVMIQRKLADRYGLKTTLREMLVDAEAAIVEWKDKLIAKATGDIEGEERAAKERQKRQRATVPLP